MTLNISILDEHELWLAVQRWLLATNHPERRGNTAGPLLATVLPLIRFEKNSQRYLKNS